MTDYYLRGRVINLRPTDVVGKGGEADIYRKGTEAFKVFKSPTHPDLSGQPLLQKEAKDRISEHQKKLPEFPRGLPRRVITPEEFLRDKNEAIVGYKMQFINDAEVLLRYGERGFREQGVSDETVRGIFLDLHKTLEEVHRRRVVVGDFNDLNVLIKGEEAYLIDTDSMQFGNFPARMFTAKFVDPINCDPTKHTLLMRRPHSPETDWYAYMIMLMQSLLFVGPYGGVYHPRDKQKLVVHDARPLRRITVFNPEVRYPKPARPYTILPDELLHYLEKVFVKDLRGIPPVAIVENLRFTKCSNCGLIHARGACPVCVSVTPAMLKEVHTGTVKGTKVFETSGQILYSAMQNGMLRYLYHENGFYRREGGRSVVEANLDPFVRFRVRGGATLFARGEECAVFEEEGTSRRISVGALGRLSLVDANEDKIFYVHGEGLYRESSIGSDYREKIADILPNQTRFWVGSTIGFGFYRAAELSMFFLFNPQRKGINDSLTLPGIKGQLIDSTCVFSSERAWFFTHTKEGNTVFNRCYLLDSLGNLLGSAEGTPGDGSWLSKIRGATALKNFLLVPTDEGVVRVSLQGSALAVSKEYQDTHRFVDAGSVLSILNDGLYVSRRRDIWKLVIS